MNEASEREAFEAWANDQGFPLRKMDMFDGSSYRDWRTQGVWDAWQARAAVAAQVEPQRVAWRFKERINDEFDSDWILTKYEPADGVRIIAKEPLCAHPPAQQAEPIARAAVPVVQEPVAWMAEDNTGYRGLTFVDPQTAEGACDGFAITPLYAAPQAAKPNSASGEAGTERDAARYRSIRAALLSGGPAWNKLAAMLNITPDTPAGVDDAVDVALSSTPAQGDASGVQPVEGPRRSCRSGRTAGADMSDLTAEAIRIADRAMWEQARSNAQVIGGKMYFVGNYPFPQRALVTACPELKEAFGYLRDRGFVELAGDENGEYMRVLSAPATDHGE